MWRTGNDDVIAAHLRHGGEHAGQIVRNLCATASGQKQQGGFALRRRIFGDEIVHFIETRIAHIVHPVAVAAVEIHLEGQDAVEMVHIGLDEADAPFLPGPNLRRDVVVDGNVGVLFDPLGNLEIEARIVHQNEAVGPPRSDVAPTLAHAAQNCGQMTDDLHQTHVSERLVVAHKGAADTLHGVAAEVAKLGLGVALRERQHQAAGVKVAAGFAGNEIVFHGTEMLVFPAKVEKKP